MRLWKMFYFSGVQTPGRCDFETGLCHWQNMTDDDFNWQRFSGNTPSRGSGPTYDHTRGFGGQGTLRVIFHWLSEMK